MASLGLQLQPTHRLAASLRSNGHIQYKKENELLTRASQGRRQELMEGVFLLSFPPPLPFHPPLLPFPLPPIPLLSFLPLPSPFPLLLLFFPSPPLSSPYNMAPFRGSAP